MSDNGGSQEKEGEVTKRCPFNGTWCSKNACALYVEYGQSIGGVARRIGMCVFVGTNVILSEMNIKLSEQGRPPLPHISLSGSFGRG